MGGSLNKKFLNKEISATIKVLDDNSMTLDHCISDDSPDRVGDDINQKGWITKDYMTNPVVLDGHDYSKPPIGKCLKLYQQGGQTRAVTQFAPTNEGKKYYQLYKSGFMSAFSVGFIPKTFNPNNSGGYHIEKQELLEYSVVTVPCNPRAVKSFLKDEGGELDMKKEEVEALVDKSIKEATKKLTEDHKKELDEKDTKIKELNETIAGLEIKSGAKLSKSSKDTLMGVCKGLRGHADTLEKFASNDGDGGTDPKTDPKSDPDAEKDYSDEEIQKMVKEKIQKAIDAVNTKKEGE